MKRLLILTAIFAAWLTLAAAAMLPGTIPTAFVPQGTQVPAHVAILDQRGPFLVVHSEDPRFVRDLYAAGAAFVLPARKKTCLDLQA